MQEQQAESMVSIHPDTRVITQSTPSLPARLTDSVSTRSDSLGQAINRCLDEFESRAFAAGIRLELSADFQELADIVAHLDRAPLTPNFDPEYSDMGPMNGFWLKGLDARGEIVQTQAIRYDNLEGISLAHHLRSLKAFYRSPAVSAHPDESCEVDAPMAYGITGRVAYHGEFWIKGGPNGFRGRDLATVLPRIGIAIALARWSPDFLYGTFNPILAEKDVAARYGYHNLQPHGMIWKRPHIQETLDEWLMWLTWREAADLIERS